jgi:lambda family phage portal protein
VASKKPPVIKQNFIDKAIQYVAPQMALERHKARLVMAMTGGGYNGAKIDKAALSNWRTYAGSPESDISPDLVNLRARSRDLVRNTPVAAGAIAQTTTNVIGTGLALAPAPDASYLGLSKEELAEWKRNTIREWKMFAESKDADLGRRMNFYQLQELAFRSFFESGDVFILTPMKNRGNVYDLALQPIEADRISNPNHGSNNDTLIDGIVIDDDGAPVKCHICNRHPGDFRRTGLKWQEFEFYGRNNRRNVIHLFKPLRPGQVRGVSMLAPIIEPLKQLGTYTNAELQAAVTSGMFSIFVKMDPTAFSTLFDPEAASQLAKDSGKWDGNLDNDGRAVNLLPGESIESANPGRPNSEFDPFVQSILRQIGMALEIPYEVLIMHYQSSYSAARGALLMAWKTYRKWRDWMATDFCQPVYVLWLDEAVAKGRVKCPAYFASPAIRAAWQGAMWIGDGPGSIDPVKEVDAAQKRVDMGISTLETESILHDGGDWEVKHEQRAKEEEMRNKAGLNKEPKPALPPPLQQDKDE